MAYVQIFIRGRLFTQRWFFSETESAMLNAAVSSASSVCQRSAFHPWESFGICANSVFPNLVKACRQKVLLHPQSSKDNHERLFGKDSVASSVVHEGAHRTGVCISNEKEMRHVSSLDKSYDDTLPSCSRTIANSAKRNERRGSSSPVVRETKLSLASSSAARPSRLESPSFEVAPEKNFEVPGAKRCSRDSRTDPFLHMQA